MKPQNLLIKIQEDRPLILIADFGLAKSLSFSSTPTTTNVASLWYRAPEVLLQCGYGLAIDLWAVGCILGELVAGAPMFVDSSEVGMLITIFATLGTPDAVVWPAVVNADNYSRSWPSWKRTERLIAMSRRFLPSLGDQGFELLLSLLQYDPSKRVAGKAAASHNFLAVHFGNLTYDNETMEFLRRGS